MGYTSDLLRGLAALIADAGHGVYDPDGTYGPDQTGITIAVVPDSPDKIICLTPYPVEDTGQTDVITAVQIRLRAGRDPTVLEDLADEIRDLLHGREHYQLGGVRVALSWRASQVPIGQDTHGRTELTANYYLRATRPGPNLTD
ncbi:hypothetical protein DMB38_12755 [Streptomyces sp. WAC 06738]|uniref:minor capsid protein n=1 Tax=Streptomyces sp. WAC 06738 TaxID=2203210 RepID=UPI000F6E7626|nr:minor capsid protein [Streptomyces sp. WAC 06738]AZM46567.1 hypothetical protein DMB38_12755 [Streptomyces sp. WAC 06738]